MPAAKLVIKAFPPDGVSLGQCFKVLLMEYNQLYFDKIIGSVTIPRWVKYIAQDNNGEWNGFAFEPIQSEDDYGFGLWDCSLDKLTDSNMYEYVTLIGRGIKPDNWKNELWEIRWV